jgi:hypothetical protein
MTQAAVTPDTTKIENQINQMEKRLDQALDLAMKPAQLDMTILLEKLAPMIQGLMLKFIPQQQTMMNQPMFNLHQMNYRQPQMLLPPSQIPQTANTTQSTPPRTRSPASNQEFQDASSTMGHSLRRTPDTSPARKKARPDEATDMDTNQGLATKLETQFAATNDTSPDNCHRTCNKVLEVQSSQNPPDQTKPLNVRTHTKNSNDTIDIQ